MQKRKKVTEDVKVQPIDFFFLIQRSFEFQDFILSLQLKIWRNNSVIFYVDMEVFETSSITELFVADGQYVAGKLSVLVLNKKQSSFVIGKMLLQLLDKWMVEITKMISIRIC